jgi:hypothetical protein
MDGTLKPQKITNLEKLKDTIHSDKSFEKNMDKSALECKCCGSMAPFLGNVDFAKTCTDRLGVAVF